MQNDCRKDLFDRAKLIQDVREVSQGDLKEIDAAKIGKLKSLTNLLLESERDIVKSEYERFNRIKHRELAIPRNTILNNIRGKRVVVTGGTGCVGSSLLQELERLNPRSLSSVSRGVQKKHKDIASVRYDYADIRNLDDLGRIFAERKPEIVYHLAAQRQPGLAESEMDNTITTNILGTQNIIRLAEENGVDRVIYASTGKAMRLHTTETYAFSKQIGEWLMQAATQRMSTIFTGVRFTHVVDNSIIYGRLLNWLSNSEPIRLHNPDNVFYVQSAIESAQLLLSATLEKEKGVFNILTIRDLDWPINLLDLALGVLAKRKACVPIYICGPEPGYGQISYPGLYGIESMNGTSPLINPFESHLSKVSETCSEINIFPFNSLMEKRIISLTENILDTCSDFVNLQQKKDDLSMMLLRAKLQNVPLNVLREVVSKAKKLLQIDNSTEVHHKINYVIEDVIRSKLYSLH